MSCTGCPLGNASGWQGDAGCRDDWADPARVFCQREVAIKEIVRELKVSRNTVRKVLRSGATCFEYARGVQPLPKLGPWRADLDRMLATNTDPERLSPAPFGLSGVA